VDGVIDINDLLGRLNRVKPRGGGWIASCPTNAHPRGDRHPGLQIDMGDRGILLYCHAHQCQVSDICAAIGIEVSDLFYEDQEVGGTPREVARYRYVDENGEILYEKVRLSPKSFRQYPGSGNTRGSIRGVRKVPYNLPQLLRHDGKVFICEGEKDCDTLAALGCVATTNPNGASNFDEVADQIIEATRGADVYITMDADLAGLERAIHVASRLRGSAADVTVLRAREGNDVTDHVVTHGLALDEMVRVASTHVDDGVPSLEQWLGEDHPDVSDLVESPSLAAQIMSMIITTDELAHIEPPAPIIDGWVFRDSLAWLFGPSGSGKSFLAVDMAMHVATAVEDWHGHRTHQGKVLYVVAEGVSGMSKRVQAWFERYGHHQADIHWLPVAINVYDLAWAAALAEVVAEMRPDLIVVDTLARSTTGAEENSAKDAGIIIENMDRLRVESGGACVLMVHHTGKNTDAGGRGSSAFKGALESEIEVRGDVTYLEVRNTKQKNIEQSKPIWFTGEEQVCAGSLALAPISVSPSDALDSYAVVAALESVFVGDPVATGTWWRAVEDGGGISKASFERLLKRLVDGGKVERVARGRYRPVIGWVDESVDL
jgi:5S rRNA maturation endonuclease (ribonuclease M5)